MAGRRLDPEEAAIWAGVARSVRRLPGRAAPPHAPSEPASPCTPTPSVLAAPKPPVKRLAAVIGKTLDGRWDRRIAEGAVAPERSIDLHGCTLAAAHRRLVHGLDLAVADGVRVMLVITGRAPRAGTSRLDLPLRGIIRASIGDWLAASRHADRIAAVRAAHPRHGGAGALYVILRNRIMTDSRHN